MNPGLPHVINFDAVPSEVVLRVVELPRDLRALQGAKAGVDQLASSAASLPASSGLPANSSAGPPASAPPEDHAAKLPGLMQDLIQQLTREFTQSEELRKLASESLQDATIELALLVASHVVQTKVDAGEFDLRGIVQDAITELLPADSITVALHPEDAVLFSDSLKEQWTTLRQEVELREDPSLPRGTCRVTNEQHALLSSPEIRLQNARESLNQALGYDDIED